MKDDSTRRSPELVLAVSALIVGLGVVLGCSSATVVKQSVSPRTRVDVEAKEYRWEPESGWVSSEGAVWGSNEQIRLAATAAFDAGAWADALYGYLELRERLAAELRTDVNFAIAECYYRLGRYDDAVEHYREVYRKGKPDEAMADATRQRIYEIALDFLHRRASCTALGFIEHDCPKHGIELLIGEEGLITEYRYLSFADDALMEIAGYYFDGREYPEAVPIYERVVSQYDDGEWAHTAQYRLALSWYNQIRGTDYDEKIIARADAEFRRYLEVDPRGPHAADSREKRREIAEMLAAKYLKIAKFYLRSSEPRAALVYLSLVLNRYTNSTAAREARVIQRQLDHSRRVESAAASRGSGPAAGEVGG